MQAWFRRLPEILETMQILIRLPLAGSAFIGGCMALASDSSVVASQWNVIDHGLSR
jgi:hypothetical protein